MCAPEDELVNVARNNVEPDPCRSHAVRQAPAVMARPKLRLDLSTAEDKENQHVVKETLKRRSSTDVVAARELQAFQSQVTP